MASESVQVGLYHSAFRVRGSVALGVARLAVCRMPRLVSTYSMSASSCFAG